MNIISTAISRPFRHFVAGMGVAAFSCGLAQAETYNLTMASSHPTVLPWVGQLSTLVVAESNNRLEAMGSQDRIEWTESYGGALFGFKDTLEAVGDGLTDAGWVGTLWEGSKMPLQNMTYFTPFVSDDLVETLKIMNELHREVPALQQAWDDQNVVFLGASGVETYHLFTNFPVNGLADLQGRKIIAPGSDGHSGCLGAAAGAGGNATAECNECPRPDGLTGSPILWASALKL